MGNYHPLKEILGIVGLGIAGLIVGFSVGTNRGFDAGVEAERQRIMGYLTAQAKDSKRAGANSISLGQETKIIPYINFWNAPHQVVDNFASNIVNNLRNEDDTRTRLFNLGLHDLGRADGYIEASDFVKSGKNNPFHKE